MKTNWASRNFFHLSFAATLLLPFATAAQETTGPQDAGLRAGKHFIPVKVYSVEEDRRVLKSFDGLRVADVCDGMDKAGLQNIGLMNSEIQPLWKDTKNYTHRIIGIAVTARYVPSQQPPAGARQTKEFDQWVSKWYTERSSEPFGPLLREGSALVIEENGGDVGSIGSNNILSFKQRGCLGVISSSTVRDTDEIITESIPLYFKRPGRGIRPGRNEIESVNAPVVCGGVLVVPGDVIVADGDGVIVVPRARAAEVADYARATLDQDKAARTRIYKELGLPKDKSVD